MEWDSDRDGEMDAETKTVWRRKFDMKSKGVREEEGRGGWRRGRGSDRKGDEQTHEAMLPGITNREIRQGLHVTPPRHHLSFL